MKRFLIAVAIIMGVTACKSKYKKAADEIFTNSPKPTNINVGKEKYSLYIPDNWTTEYRDAYGIHYYYLLAPATKDDPNTNINVVRVSEFMQNLSLEDFLNGTIQSVEKSIPSAEILGRGQIAANELKGVWYSYYMEPQGIKSTLISYIFPKDGIAYIITAGTQAKDFKMYKNTFDSVAKSFKFIQE